MPAHGSRAPRRPCGFVARATLRPAGVAESRGVIYNSAVSVASKRNVAIVGAVAVLALAVVAVVAFRDDEAPAQPPTEPSASSGPPMREPIDEVFRFNAAVRKAEGAVPAGLDSRGRCDIRVFARDEEIRGLRIKCGDVSVYDDVDKGAAGDLKAELRELPAPGSNPKDPAWVYEVEYSRRYQEKTPMHTVPQIELDSAQKKLRVFSEHEPTYSVEAELVETQAGFRRGEGLLPEHR